MKLLIAAFFAGHALIHLSYLTPAPPRTAGGARMALRDGPIISRGIDMTAPAAAALTDDVVLCEGVLHPVVAGRVACPQRDAPTRVKHCDECHLLTWRSDDRLQPSDCSTESTADR